MKPALRDIFAVKGVLLLFLVTTWMGVWCAWTARAHGSWGDSLASVESAGGMARQRMPLWGDFSKKAHSFTLELTLTRHLIHQDSTHSGDETPHPGDLPPHSDIDRLQSLFPKDAHGPRTPTRQLTELIRLGAVAPSNLNEHAWALSPRAIFAAPTPDLATQSNKVPRTNLFSPEASRPGAHPPQRGPPACLV